MYTFSQPACIIQYAMNVLLLIPLIFAERRLIRSSLIESFDVGKTEINASKLPDDVKLFINISFKDQQLDMILPI
jgi:hypothetical protein